MYVFKDKIYTEDQLNEIAEIKGYTFDELLANNPDIVKEGDDEKKKKENVEKPQGTAEGADVVPDPAAPESTELESESISLDTPSQIEPIDVQQIINTPKDSTPPSLEMPEEKPEIEDIKIESKKVVTKDLGDGEKEYKLDERTKLLTDEDREVINSLKQNDQLWQPYYKGNTLDIGTIADDEANKLMYLQRMQGTDLASGFTTREFDTDDLGGKGLQDVVDAAYYIPTYLNENGDLVEGSPIRIVDSKLEFLRTGGGGKEIEEFEVVAEDPKKKLLFKYESYPEFEELSLQEQQNLNALDKDINELATTTDQGQKDILNVRINENLSLLSNNSMDLFKKMYEDPYKFKYLQDKRTEELTGTKVDKILNVNGAGFRDKEGKIDIRRSHVVYIAKKEAEPIVKSINKFYVNYGLGSDFYGDEVFVAKNPSFYTKESAGEDSGLVGRLDILSTAKANGITEEEIQANINPGSFKTEEESAKELLLSKGFGAQMTVGLGGVGGASFTDFFGQNNEYWDNNYKPEIVNLLNFIDQNKGKYRPNSELKSIDRFAGERIDYENQKIAKQASKERDAAIQKVQSLENKYLEDFNNLFEQQKEVSAAENNILELNKVTKEKALSYTKRQEVINSDIENLTTQLQNEKTRIEREIKVNPSKSENLKQEFNKYYSEYKQNVDNKIKEFNDINLLIQGLDDSYQKDFIDKNKSYRDLYESYDKERKKLDVTANKVDQLLQVANVSNMTLSRLQFEADYTSKLINDVEEYAEGEGSFISESVNKITEQYFRTAGGKVSMLQDVAGLFNELGYALNITSEGEYKYQKGILEAQKKSLSSEIAGAASVFKIEGIDRFYTKAYEESTAGGVVKALGEMLGASMGTPVSGLFGGFFFSSLMRSTEEDQMIRDTFIKDAMAKDPNLTNAQANRMFDKEFKKDVNFARKYLRATLEGSLEYLSGKILGGQFKITRNVTNKLMNGVLSRLTGNVTVKTLQREAQLLVGSVVSKAASRVGKVAGTGFDEALTEIIQELGDVAVQKGFADALGRGITLDLPDVTSDDYLNQLKHIGTVAFLTGGVGGVYQASIQAPKVLSGVDLLKGEQRATVELYTRERANILRSKDQLNAAIANIPQNDPNRKAKILKAQQLYDIYSGINQNLSGIAQTQVAELYMEKQALEAKLEGQNKYDVKGIKDAISEIQSQIDAIETDPSNLMVNATAEQAIEAQQEIGRETGRDIQEVENEQDFIKAAQDAGIEISGKEDALYVKGDGKIIVNKKAMKDLFSISAETHEILHDITAQELQGLSEDQKQILIKDFQNELSTNEYNAVIARLKKDYPNVNQATTEEWFNAFHDAVVRGDIKYNETIFDQIGRWLIENIPGFKRLFGSEKDLNWDSARGVYNFIKDYSVQTRERIEGKRQQFTPEIKEVVETQTPTTRETQVVEMTDQVQPAMAASRSVSEMSNAFDAAITNDLKNNTDFKNSEAALVAYNEINDNNQFNSYINQLINRDNNLQSLPDNIKQEVNRKIKEELQLRVLKNFSPVLDGNKRSLFSYLYGKKEQGGLGGIAQKALLDVKKQYAKAVPTTSIDQTTDDTARPREIEDTSVNIEEQIDEGQVEVPRSRLKQAAPELVTKEVEDAIEKAVQELEAGVRPGVDDKNFRSFVKEVLEEKITPTILEKFGTGKNYESFIKSFAPKLREMPAQFFVKLESQTKPENRKFTKPPRRLTKQRDIDAAQLRDDVFVENTAQGVNLYEFKNFTDKDIVDAVFPPLINPKTGKRSGARGNVKKSVAKSIAAELGKDMVPPVFRKSTKPQELSKISRKLQRDPRAMFSNSVSENTIINSGSNQIVYEDYLTDQFYWKKLAKEEGGRYYDFNNPKDLQEWKEKEFPKLVKIFPKDFLLNCGAFFGRRGFPFKDEVNSNHRQYFENYLNENFEDKDYGPPIENLKIALKKQGQKSAKFNTKYFGSSENIENNIIKDKVLQEVFTRIQNAEGNITSAAVGMLKTTSLEQAHFMRKIAPITFRQLGLENLPSGAITEEHALGASLVAKQGLFLANGGLVNANFAGIVKNYVQGPISKVDDNKVNRKLYGMKTGPKKEDLYLTLMGVNDWVVRYASVPDFDLNTIEYLDDNGNVSLLTEYYNVKVNVKSFPELVAFQNDLIVQIAKQQITKEFARKQMDAALPALQEQAKASKEDISMLSNSKVLSVSEDLTMEEILGKALGIDAALKYANKLDQPIKKIRIFDFDDTLAFTKSDVLYTAPDGTTGKLNAEQFAKQGADLREQGYEFDFSEFNKVSQGKRGPLFNLAKKIKAAKGNEDLFVLTARAPEAQYAIYEFLKAEGLEFKLENIVGLGNSKGEAKANWIINKAAEGYNDFYFADDAYQNVKAVRDALSVIDVKSRVQQAKVRLSNSLSEDFNKLLEQSTGTEFYKEYSPAKAKTIGASKGKFKFFIPYSAEDLLGLIYPTLGRGALGDKQMAWYKKNLLNPYMSAMESLSAARVNLMNDFKQLKKSLDVPKDLRKTNQSGFTNEQAVRVYLYTTMDYEIPGLSKRDLKELNDVILNDPKLKTFAEQILSITKGDGYAKPDANWLAGTITTDLIDLLNKVKRAKYLQDSGYTDNVNAIYNEANLNKLEALYGSKYREALENILSRMKSGRNRMFAGNRLSNRVLDYINGSIGTIMFFNTRSAVLQTISSINFINWSFNNPYQAGKAFANQKQYWKDFTTLMNSDYLRDRRNGLRLNISESEIADAAATSKNKAKAVISYILEKGYLPTQYADSFAIASGGATWYRNKIKQLTNEGVEIKEAERQALLEWRQIAEESQQSSDPSKISQQQSSDLGRIVLAFANTPMQYARLQKRAIQDLVNNRGDWKSNMSKVIYYGVVQNLIFNALQQAIFALGFGDDEEDEEKEKKYMRIANGMLDSLLRGIGIGGQAVSVAKNFLLDIYERSGRSRPEYIDSVWKLTQFSPPINSKISKLKQAAWHFDSKKRRQKMFDEGFSLDNPAYEAFAKVISAVTNVPLDRVLYKLDNLEGAMSEDNEVWERIAMLLGWPQWQLETKKEKDKKKDTGTKVGGIKIKKQVIKIK